MLSGSQEVVEEFEDVANTASESGETIDWEGWDRNVDDHGLQLMTTLIMFRKQIFSFKLLYRFNFTHIHCKAGA